jgi:hypothetical protein
MTEDDSHGLYGRSVADFIAVVIAVDESSVDHRWGADGGHRRDLCRNFHMPRVKKILREALT